MAMRFKLLGKSGLRVSELCLGTMTFGEDWGWGAAKEECGRILAKFVDAGGNFVDTAVNYTNGTSEAIVGELAQPMRDRLVLATKYTLSRSPDDPNACGNQRKNMTRSLEASLKRLRTDHIDLYWVHAWDPLTPTEEVMRALDDAVRAGKVLYVGVSDHPAWVVAHAVTLAELRGWSRFVGLQIPYSLIERAPERELLPMAQAFDLGVATWGALGGGVLTGKYEKGKPHPQGDRLSEGSWGRLLTDRNLAIGAEVKAVAAELDRTPTQVAVAWVLHQRGARGNIIPILGVRRSAQLDDNLAALSLRLPDAALARLEAASAIDLGFPHDFLDRLRPIIYGNTRELIDDHRR